MLVETRDGRSLSGFLAEKYDEAIVLRDLAGERTLIAKTDLISMKSAGRSLMPEGLLDAFDEQQLRDLFAYLRSTQPLVKRQ
jgi:putative heme-binding domain-containing protein